MDFTQILEYQEIDKKLFKIEMEIQNSKDRKLAIESRDFLKASSGPLQEMESKSIDYKKQYDKLNGLFNEKKQAFEAYKDKANKANTEDEINASIEELNGASRELQSLSSQLFNLIKNMDELSRSYVDLLNKMKEARDAYDQARQKFNKFKESKEAEKSEFVSKLEELKKNVDPSMFEMYSKLRDMSIMPVITQLDGSHCSSCGMTISQAQIEEINSKGHIECENCRRIIIK